MTVACLHTSQDDVARYSALFPSHADVTHSVRPDLLVTARRSNQNLVEMLDKAVSQLGQNRCVLCTCTTLAPYLRTSETVLDILSPALHRASNFGPRIAIVHYREDMPRLVRAVLAKMQNPPTTEVSYVKTTMATVAADLASVTETDAILLGQASMQGLAQTPNELGLPVLATPACAVRAITGGLLS